MLQDRSTIISLSKGRPPTCSMLPLSSMDLLGQAPTTRLRSSVTDQLKLKWLPSTTGVASSASVSVSPFSQCSPQQPGSLMPYSPAAMYGPGPSSGVPIHGNGPHYWNNPPSAQFGVGLGSPSPSSTAADRSVRRPSSARSTGGKGRRPRDEGEPASGPLTTAKLPERTDPDYDIHPNDVLCCDNCGSYIGRFDVMPCGHYGFCHRCLSSEKGQASKANRPEKCLACNKVS
ncbi:hypothetical protein FOCC_FOCC013606 [Frankliniella occidentalis]|uniref:Uncharacterized protein LOC113215701 n=1 Tax=Frankliniella occidentalis TaxID=133901 RepID=A0A6J1TC52_FRAOC|nr:uncharacterized protein LOC113215701 [Frankliniella occidentalis]KAE8740860.1 hypothetical protein FOCC_FOCC013606 [Frankliniella occidentalis]